MKTKLVKSLLAVGAVALSCLVAVTIQASAQPKKVNIAFVVVDDDPLSQAMHVMAQYMKRSAPNSFDVEVHPASTLFQQSQQIPAMTRGNLEIGYVNFADIADQIPEASILMAGYLLRDIEHQCAVMNSDFGQDLQAKVESKMGIKVLGQALIGYRTLVLRKKRKVDTPADIADLTMREVGSEAFQFLAEALGAKPTPIAYSELYLALQTGTVDAFAGFATAMKNTKFYEVTEQFVLTNHLMGADLIGVSMKFWKSLTADEQQIVREAAEVASMFCTNTRKRLINQSLDEIRKLGLEVTTPNVEAFRAHMRDKYLSSKFAKSWPKGLWEKIASMPSPAGCTIK